jgi:hypothetical protein
LKKKTWSRLSPEEVQKRVLELETIYGQEKLSKILGVSKDSIRRYRDGKTFPQTQTIYKHINSLYYQNKNYVVPEKVEKKKQAIKKKSLAQLAGRIKSRYASIYDYVNTSPLDEFQGAKNIDKLFDMSDSGYVVGWRGREVIPLEVQFLAEGYGESLTRFGNVVNIITIVSRYNSPKEGVMMESEGEMIIQPIWHRLIKGFKKSLNFEERMNILREYAMNIKIDRGYTVAFLGYYFEEGDEI